MSELRIVGSFTGDTVDQHVVHALARATLCARQCSPCRAGIQCAEWTEGLLLKQGASLLLASSAASLHGLQVQA